MKILKLFHLAWLANGLFNFLMYLSCYVFNRLSAFSLSTNGLWLAKIIGSLCMVLQKNICVTNSKPLKKELNVIPFYAWCSTPDFYWNFHDYPNNEIIFSNSNYHCYTGSLGNLLRFWLLKITNTIDGIQIRHNHSKTKICIIKK